MTEPNQFKTEVQWGLRFLKDGQVILQRDETLARLQAEPGSSHMLDDDPCEVVSRVVTTTPWTTP